MRIRIDFLIGATVFLALYLVYLCYNLNYFYISGASVYDAGWFCWLSNHSVSWPMPNPLIIAHDSLSISDFLSIHVSLIFFFTSMMSRVMGHIPDAVKFSLLFSLWLPVFWLAMFSLSSLLNGLSLPRRVGFALLMTFNGLNLSMPGFPHIESFIPAFGLLGVAFLMNGSGFVGVMAAFCCILLALLMREDAGLHLFLVFAGLVLCAAIARAPKAGRFSAFAILVLSYAIFVLIIQKLFVPAGGLQILYIYLGDPLFSSLTPGDLEHRLIYWLTRRAYIFLPFAILCVACAVNWSGRRRSLLVGIALALPWLLLSFLAVMEAAGELWDYYCFPLIFMFVWPLLLAAISGDHRGLVSLQTAMAVASLVVFLLMGTLPFVGAGGSHDRAPWLHLTPPSLQMIEQTEADVGAAGPVIMDSGAASIGLGGLRIGQYRQKEKFTASDLAQASAYLRFVTPPPAFLADKTAMLAAMFPVCTRLDGTYLEMCRRAGS